MMLCTPRFGFSGHIVAAGGQVGRWAGGQVGRWAGGQVGRWVARKLNTKDFYTEIGAGEVFK
jgi:hypothetical protein